MKSCRWFVRATDFHPVGSIYFASESSPGWFVGVAPDDIKVWLLWVDQYDAHLLIHPPLDDISHEAYRDLLRATSATVTDHPERPRVHFTDEALAYLKIGYS